MNPIRIPAERPTLIAEVIRVKLRELAIKKFAAEPLSGCVKISCAPHIKAVELMGK